MSVSILIEGWDEQPTKQINTYMDEQFPSLDNEYFEEDRLRDPEHVKIEEGTGRYYMIETVFIDGYPNESFATDNWGRILRDLGVNNKDVHGDELNANELDMLFKKLMVRRNQRLKELESEFVQDGRVIEFIPGNDYYDRAYDRLLEVVKFAKQHNKTIYWG